MHTSPRKKKDKKTSRAFPQFPSLQKISQKLSDCVNYIHAVHFHGFEESAKSGKYYHMSSFGESKVIKKRGG